MSFSQPVTHWPELRPWSWNLWKFLPGVAMLFEAWGASVKLHSEFRHWQFGPQILDHVKLILDLSFTWLDAIFPPSSKIPLLPPTGSVHRANTLWSKSPELSLNWESESDVRWWSGVVGKIPRILPVVSNQQEVYESLTSCQRGRYVTASAVIPQHILSSACPHCLLWI